MVNRLLIQADNRQREAIKDAIIQFCGEQSIDVTVVKVSDEERILELKKELEEYEISNSITTD